MFSLLAMLPSLSPPGLPVKKEGVKTQQSRRQKDQAQIPSMAVPSSGGQAWGRTPLVRHHIMPVQRPKRVGCSKAVMGAEGPHNRAVS